MEYKGKYTGEEIDSLLDKIKNGGDPSSGNSAYPLVEHGTSDTTITLTPNTFHIWGEVATLELSLDSETSGIANEYLFQFTSGATATTLSLPDGIKWANNTPPTIAENMIYQISILRGLASVLEFSNELDLIENRITATISGNYLYISLEYPAASDIIITYMALSANNITLIAGEDSYKTLADPGQESVTIVNVTPSVDSTYKYVW